MIYLASTSKTLGGFTLPAVAAFLCGKSLPSDLHFWREGMGDWQPIGDLALAIEWAALSEAIVKAMGAPAATPHALAAPLVVSLTSHPARFDTLHLTLHCLLCQSTACDRILLWIAQADAQKLPKQVRQLEGDRLAIGYCDDLRAYKKIIPTLECYPDAYIVTTDDDAFYKPNWLEGLVSVARKHPTDVVAHIVRRIALNRKKLPARYAKWSFVDSDTSPSPHNFPTGIGGVLYPPGAFHEDVFRRNLFEKFSPTNDDIWLYWMWRRNGRQCRYTGDPFLVPAITWPETQRSSLWQINKIKNDSYIAAMVKKYGLPS
jgi:hypothetical protein